MRGRWILVVSLGLNLVLLMVFASKHRRSMAPVTVTNAAPAVSNHVRTLVSERKQFFSWQELESADYPTFITNLRNIGCPEQTIRDIIIADVKALYARKRLEQAPTPEQQWWRSEPDTNVVQALNAKLQALEDERRALLTTLLGPNWDAAETPPPQLVALSGPVLGDLAPETKNSVQDIITRSQQRTQAYLEAQKAAGRTADPAELARLGQQTRNELSQVLTPAQLEEFLLRYSENAAALREQLRGITLSPDEFRNLFRLADPIEQQMQLATGTAQDRASLQATLAKQLVEALRSVLGPDRYQAYRVAQDPVYRDAVAQAEDAGASPQAAQALYQLSQAYLQESNRIRNDATLSDDQKAAQLKALDQQKQNASDQLLGLSPPPTPPPVPPTPTAGAGQTHPYSPGETVDFLAAKFGVSSTAILNANPNLNFNNLSRGSLINIPPPPQQ